MKNYIKEMNTKGYANLEIKIDNEDLDWFAEDIFNKKQKEIDHFGRNICFDKAYLDISKCLYNGEKQYEKILCSDWINESVDELIGKNAIIYDVFGLINIDQKNTKHRRNEWHRDQMYLGGIRASVLYFIPLVDFTENNGPTEIVAGSHLLKNMPPEEECNLNHEKILAKKGEVFVVDSSIVHRAGENKSNLPRPALLIRYQLPFLIRQINLSNHYKKNKNQLPELLIKRFGFGLEFDNLEESILKDRPKNIYEVNYYE